MTRSTTITVATIKTTATTAITTAAATTTTTTTNNYGTMIATIYQKYDDNKIDDHDSDYGVSKK